MKIELSVTAENSKEIKKEIQLTFGIFPSLKLTLVNKKNIRQFDFNVVQEGLNF